MKIRILWAVVVFLGSYAPLSLILCVKNIDYQMLSQSLCLQAESFSLNCLMPPENPFQSLILLYSLVASTLFLLITILVLKSIRTKRRIIIKSSKHTSTELISYTIPYIISFLSANHTNSGEVISLFIFMFLMFLMTYRSGQIIMNPILIIFGWRLYDIEYTSFGDAFNREYSSKVLSKVDIIPGYKYAYNEIQNMIIIKNKIEND